MKRRWSLMLLTLASLLLTLAVACYVFWPVSPVFRLSDQEFVGIDEARRILYSTTHRAEEEQLLRAYDLSSGQLLYSKALPCKPLLPGRKRVEMQWPLRLSADGNYLIPMSSIGGVLPAIRIARMESLSEKPLSGFMPRECSVTPDGKLLLIHENDSFDHDTWLIRDLVTNELVDRIELPHRPIEVRRGASNELPSDALAITPDHGTWRGN